MRACGEGRAGSMADAEGHASGSEGARSRERRGRSFSGGAKVGGDGSGGVLVTRHLRQRDTSGKRERPPLGRCILGPAREHRPCGCEAGGVSRVRGVERGDMGEASCAEPEDSVSDAGRYMSGCREASELHPSSADARTARTRSSTNVTRSQWRARVPGPPRRCAATAAASGSAEARRRMRARRAWRRGSHCSLAQAATSPTGHPKHDIGCSAGCMTRTGDSGSSRADSDGLGEVVGAAAEARRKDDGRGRRVGRSGDEEVIVCAATEDAGRVRSGSRGAASSRCGRCDRASSQDDGLEDRRRRTPLSEGVGDAPVITVSPEDGGGSPAARSTRPVDDEVRDESGEGSGPSRPCGSLCRGKEARGRVEDRVPREHLVRCSPVAEESCAAHLHHELRPQRVSSEIAVMTKAYMAASASIQCDGGARTSSIRAAADTTAKRRSGDGARLLLPLLPE